MPAWLVVGTDTDVGKTHVSCALLATARKAGFTAVGMKPVAAGAEEIDGRVQNADTARLIAASSGSLEPGIVTPYCLQNAIAPHLAAAEEGIEIDFKRIFKNLSQLSDHSDLVVVEGVGGFLVPLRPEKDFGDLAQVLALPVLLVVGMRLGCINHALLSVEAIAARGLDLAGWVANRIDPTMTRFDENLAALEARIPAPLLGVLPYGVPPEAVELRLPGYEKSAL